MSPIEMSLDNGMLILSVHRNHRWHPWNKWLACALVFDDEGEEISLVHKACHIYEVAEKEVYAFYRVMQEGT